MIQHWVETRWHGSVVEMEGERSQYVEETEADRAPNVSLGFDDGPGNGDDAKPLLAGAEALPGDAACQQVCAPSIDGSMTAGY